MKIFLENLYEKNNKGKFLFFERKNNGLASYADDPTLYTCLNGVPTLNNGVQSTSNKMFNWFKNK